MAATITEKITSKLRLPTIDDPGLSTIDEPVLSNGESGLSTIDEPGLPPSKYLCLTILGYRKPGMSEEAYRRHMNEVSAQMTKDLMVKYGVKRWTVIHNPTRTRTLMNEIYDRQMSNVADYDCFSQVVFESLAHYKRMKEDPYYQLHLFNDHENFADTTRSQMTIGWIEEWINEGAVREGLAFSCSG